MQNGFPANSAADQTLCVHEFFLQKKCGPDVACVIAKAEVKESLGESWWGAHLTLNALVSTVCSSGRRFLP